MSACSQYPKICVLPTPTDRGPRYYCKPHLRAHPTCTSARGWIAYTETPPSEPFRGVWAPTFERLCAYLSKKRPEVWDSGVLAVTEGIPFGEWRWGLGSLSKLTPLGLEGD